MRRLVGLLLVLFLHAQRLFVRAHLFSWLVDWQTVCEPDYIQCPNGGLTFRDRKHGCEFVPCEFIPTPPLPPPRPDPKTYAVSKWFGRYEFLVPTLNVDALLRGKAVEREWVEAIMSKREHPMRANFSATIDLYIVAKPPPTESVKTEYVAHACDLHMDALVASQVELFVEEERDSAGSSSSSHADAPSAGTSSTASEMAVSMPPWTRREFFGHFGGSSMPPSLTTVQTALRLLKNKTTTKTHASPIGNASRFATLVLEAATEADIMTDLISQCDTALASTSGPSTASFLVFVTDLSAVKSSAVSEDLLRPWNMTECDAHTASRIASHIDNMPVNTSSSVTLADPSTHVLFSSRNTSHSQDAGHVETNCSCWTRAIVGVLDRNHTTQWMLC